MKDSCRERRDGHLTISLAYSSWQQYGWLTFVIIISNYYYEYISSNNMIYLPPC